MEKLSDCKILRGLIEKLHGVVVFFLPQSYLFSSPTLLIILSSWKSISSVVKIITYLEARGSCKSYILNQFATTLPDRLYSMVCIFNFLFSELYRSHLLCGSTRWFLGDFTELIYVFRSNNHSILFEKVYVCTIVLSLRFDVCNSVRTD